jgi:peptidyl-prolyl cis-trans isomerase B (cyclophilin B)
MSFVSKFLLALVMVTLAFGTSFAKEKEKVVVIKTEKGDIVIKLLKDEAPKHAENFINLSKSGFYNGLTFHRVEPNFVVQGGDPAGNGTGGPDEAAIKKAYGGKVPAYMKPGPRGGDLTLPAEIKALHIDGAVAAARLGDGANPERRSSGSQFYICNGPQSFLDGQYTVFGQVVEGMDVVRKIQRGDKMLSVTIKEK